MVNLRKLTGILHEISFFTAEKQELTVFFLFGTRYYVNTTHYLNPCAYYLKLRMLNLKLKMEIIMTIFM